MTIFDEENTRASTHDRIRSATSSGGVSKKRQEPNERYRNSGKALVVGKRLIKRADGLSC